MKTFLLGLMLLGLTNLSFSQNELAVADVESNVQYTHTTTKSSTIPESQISKRIKAFQNEVSGYDITSKAIYTPNEPATYKVVFNEGNNAITNVYGHDGKVISSKQKFENIRLPYSVSQRILKDYPGWYVNSVNCTIKYDNGAQAIVTYKVKVSNGTKNKMIKISV